MNISFIVSHCTNGKGVHEAGHRFKLYLGSLWSQSAIFVRNTFINEDMAVALMFLQKFSVCSFISN